MLRYLISFKPKYVADDDAAEGTTTGDRKQNRDGRNSTPGEAGNNGRGGKMSKEQKKARQGQNKGRKFGKVRDELDLCWRIANGTVCEYGAELSRRFLSLLFAYANVKARCRFTHDVAGYLAAKAPDIHMPEVSQILEEPPFVPNLGSLRSPHPQYPSLDLNTVCPVFAETGECR